MHIGVNYAYLLIKNKRIRHLYEAIAHSYHNIFKLTYRYIKIFENERRCAAINMLVRRSLCSKNMKI